MSETPKQDESFVQRLHLVLGWGEGRRQRWLPWRNREAQPTEVPGGRSAQPVGGHVRDGWPRSLQDALSGPGHRQLQDHGAQVSPEACQGPPAISVSRILPWYLGRPMQLNFFCFRRSFFEARQRLSLRPSRPWWPGSRVRMRVQIGKVRWATGRGV